MLRDKKLSPYIVMCFMLIYTSIAHSGESEWELGAGLAVLDIPFYPGSSQSKAYLLPIPHIFYRSEKLEVDNGLEVTFLKTPRTRLNLSADFAVPVNSKDSDARTGMPNLDLVIQIGPSLEVTLSGGRFKPSHFRLELPIRTAIATDFRSAENVGWIFEPRLTFETRRPHKTGFAYLVSGGLRFSTEELHQYYYGVEQQFVTPERTRFDASAGYSGLFIDYIANWRTENLIFFALLRYQNIAGAAFEDSPLVEQDDYLIFGAGITWIFARNL
jgi:outer membrane scaffolding protein for murein synthesis (MipA/OmpV family)